MVSLENIYAGIDRQLDYLHKERWAERAADLRQVVRSSEGAEKANAERALHEHYGIRFKPETSRDELREDAAKNYTIRQSLGQNASPDPLADRSSEAHESKRAA